MVLLIDNYDSFTYNLVQYIRELGSKVLIRRNDKLNVNEAMEMKPDGIVLSPGPSNPNRAGICLELTREAAKKNIPLLGVCLGHQVIGQAFGGKIIPAQEIMHGKISRISHCGTGIFTDVPSPFVATRYHSLVVGREKLPKSLEITALVEDGTVMGLQHKTLPIFGVQFHPESIASKHGHQLLQNFLNLI